VTPELLRAALAEHVSNANMSAFLRVIRAGETSQDDGAYHTLVGNTRFESLASHPRQMVWLPNLRVNSSAAGAYQFLGRTWDECVKALALPDFGKASQDVAAVFLIRRRGALEDVLAGRLEAAIRKCAKEWASLPGSPYGQPVMTMAKAKAVYAQYGGSLNTSPEPVQIPPENAHVKEAPVAPLIAAAGKSLLAGLAKTLISGFMPLATEKIEREIGRHTDRPEVVEQITDAVITAAKVATGLEDPIEAVAEARKDPQVLAQVEASVLDKLTSMAPLLERMAALDLADKAATEASYDAAAKRAAGNPNDQDTYLTQSIVRMTVGLMVLAAVLTGALAWLKVSDTILMAVFGLFNAGALLVLSKFGTRYDHRYGSSTGSAAKDVVIRKLTNGKQP
jgi:muramidase (phage lysozyme)